MQKRIKRMVGNGMGLMVGSMATSKIGAMGGKSMPADIESNIQGGFSIASIGNIVEGAGIANDSMKKLYKRRR